MGQTSSAQREQRFTSRPEYSVPPQSRRGRFDRHDDMNDRRTTEQAIESHLPAGTEIGNGINQAIQSGRPNFIPGPLESGTSGGTSVPRTLRGAQEHGTSFELQREYPSTSFTRISARRQSTMSRLGSRILPNSVIRGLLSSEEETPAEGLAHRHGIVSRSIPRSETAHSSSRFSAFGSLGSRGITRRRSARGSYVLPRGDSTLASDASSTTYFDASNDLDSSGGSRRRNARLQRVRNSLSNPISHMFGHSDSARRENGGFREPLPRAMDTRMDFDNATHELDSVEPAVRNAHPRPGTPIPEASTATSPTYLRARTPRIMRPEEQTPLSRVLQLAASAIAAQLSGSNGPTMPNVQALGNDGLGGSLENFLQTLQQSAFNQANNPTSSDGPGASGVDGPPSPVNFLRVFRFANTESPGDSDSPSDGMDIDNADEGTEGRTVTLVVVGVRSVPSSTGEDSDQQTDNPPGLDALLRLPFFGPGILPRNRRNEPGAPPRPRFTGRRTASGLNERSGTLDSANEARVPNRLRRPSDVGTHSTVSSLPTALSDSPPGPHPPPSTPASPGLSAVPSGASTPSRRPSSASAMPFSTLPQLHEYQSMQPSIETVEDGIPLRSTARQRRRSDSEFTRHRYVRHPSPGADGTVEPGSVMRGHPDRAIHEPVTPPPSRSWLIYVVGTNLSENHPALATPSLFTDVSIITRPVFVLKTNFTLQNPTYEDMILLSSLLGPARPPVATKEDVHSAGGLFRLMEYSGSLVAEAIDGGDGTVRIPDGDRCLICLSDYEAAEEVRQLSECKHVYHRECIDHVCPLCNPTREARTNELVQWLTTGRNSCPLCRGQGVVENQRDPAPDGQAAV